MTEATGDENLTQSLQQAVADVFSVEAVMVDVRQTGVIHLYGRFIIDPAEAYPIAQRRFHNLGYTPLFQEEGERCVIRALPQQLPTTEPNVRWAAILLGLTVLSTLFVGVQINWDIERTIAENLLSVETWQVAASFALPMLSILLAHEMGHYLVARRLGVPVTLPFFIPMPISPLGTMGALIQMKAPPRNRRHLLAVGVAGPLAGLILALPLLVLGLHLSEQQSNLQSCYEIQTSVPSQEAYYTLEGNSVLYAAVKTVMFGRFLPDCTPGQPRTSLDLLQTALFGCPPCEGEDVFIHPVAFAAWAGLLVTGLNLIPAGTLDGGHVATALLGKRARYVTWAMVGVTALMGFLWPGWWLWSGLIFLLGRRSAVPLDEITQLKPWQVIAAWLMLILFLLTVTPVPMTAIPVVLPG